MVKAKWLVVAVVVCVAAAAAWAAGQGLRWEYRSYKGELLRIDRLTGDIYVGNPLGERPWVNFAREAKREARAKTRAERSIRALLKKAEREYSAKYSDYVHYLDELWAYEDAPTRARRIANDINYWAELSPDQRRELEQALPAANPEYYYPADPGIAGAMVAARWRLAEPSRK